MNNENLIPLSKRTKSEQREIQSKGGKASGISRSFKSALKKKFKENPELYEELINMLTDEALTGRNLKAQIKEIEDFVNSIPNYHLKKAVCIYYINDVESGEDKPTWEDVAEEIGNGFTSKKLEVQLGRYIKSYNSFQKKCY